MQTPSAIASTGIATIPNISARGSDATHAVKGLGCVLPGFAATSRSPIRSLPRDQFTINRTTNLHPFATEHREITNRYRLIF